MVVLSLISLLVAVDYYLNTIGGWHNKSQKWGTISVVDLCLILIQFRAVERYGLGLMYYSVLLMSIMLVILAFTDLKTGHLPVVLIGVGFAFALVLLWLNPHILWYEQIIGAAITFLVFFMLHRILRGGIGDGDVYVLTLITLVLGWQHMLQALLLGLLLTSFVGIFLIIIKGVSRKTVLPFVPFLAMAHFVLILI